MFQTPTAYQETIINLSGHVTQVASQKQFNPQYENTFDFADNNIFCDPSQSHISIHLSLYLMHKR